MGGRAAVPVPVEQEKLSRHQVASEQRSQAGGRRQGKMPSLG